MEPIKYEIDGTVYTQRPLVLGQIGQVVDALRDFTMPARANGVDLVMMLGDKLPGLLAIVLGIEGVPMQNKDIAALTEELRYSVPTETAIKMVDDFFVCNPIASLAEKMSGWMEILTAWILARYGSTTLSSCSPAEISPGAMQSNGDSPSGT
jgi:hypothetical protein